MPSLGDERGFTLPEILVSIVVLGFVLTAILSALDTTTALSTRHQERPAAIHEARTGLSSIVRELRQAYQVVSASPKRMEVLVRLNGEASSYYGVTAKVPAKGERKSGYQGNVVFHDGFRLPNNEGPFVGTR